MSEHITSFTGTLPQLLAAQAARFGAAQTAIRDKAYGIWQTYHWEDYLRYVKHVGLGLIALGFRRGESAGLITDNHPEWLFAELGTQAVGGITLNLFTSAVADELSTSLKRIRASFVFAQDQEQVDKMIAVRGSLGHVRHVIYIDPTGMGSYRDDPWLISFRDLLKMGEELDQEHPDRFPDGIAAGETGGNGPDDPDLRHDGPAEDGQAVAPQFDGDGGGLGPGSLHPVRGELDFHVSSRLDRRPDVGTRRGASRRDDDELSGDAGDGAGRFPGNWPLADHHRLPFLGRSGFPDHGSGWRMPDGSSGGSSRRPNAWAVR